MGAAKGLSNMRWSPRCSWSSRSPSVHWSMLSAKVCSRSTSPRAHPISWTAGSSRLRGISFTTEGADERGQATLEAVFLLPVLFIILLMLIQPTVLLYDHMVMQQAAGEGCRLLMTKDSSFASVSLPGSVVSDVKFGDDPYRDYVMRHLGAIPPLPLFHLHEDGCSYEIDLQGDETSEQVMVTIRNKLQLLPLLGQAASLMGVCEADGIYTQEVRVSLPSRPNWVSGTPEEWAASWT